MENQNLRLLLDQLVATADREDTRDGYCLEECKKLRRDMIAFLDGTWRPAPEHLHEVVAKYLFCALDFARQGNFTETLTLLQELPDLANTMANN